MKPKQVISIAATLLLVTALSGCGVEASTVATASAAPQQPPAIEPPAPTIEPKKWDEGDGSFKAYDYY
jgi:hypothetical protein